MRNFVFPWSPDENYPIVGNVIGGGASQDAFPIEGDTLKLYGELFIAWMVAGLFAFLVIHWLVGMVREAIG